MLPCKAQGKAKAYGMSTMTCHMRITIQAWQYTPTKPSPSVNIYNLHMQSVSAHHMNHNDSHMQQSLWHLDRTYNTQCTQTPKPSHDQSEMSPRTREKNSLVHQTQQPNKTGYTHHIGHVQDSDIRIATTSQW